MLCHAVRLLRGGYAVAAVLQRNLCVEQKRFSVASVACEGRAEEV